MSRRDSRGTESSLVPWILVALLVGAAVTQVITAQRGAFPGRLDGYLTNSVKLSGDQSAVSGPPVDLPTLHDEYKRFG